jgi:tetratricopeptide (TPR) repeat protein
VYVVLGVVLAVGAVVTGVAALGLVLALRRSSPPRVPQQAAGREAAVPEDEGQRRQEVMAAFQNQKPLDAQEITRELQPLFNGLGAAFGARDGERIMAHFDVDRLVDELVALDAVPPQALRDRRPFVRGMRGGMGRSMAQRAPLLAWAGTEIRHVKKLEGNEAVVIARHRTGEGVSLKLRWWVTKRPGAWKVHDMEDLDTGLRVSTTMGTLAGAGFGDVRGTAAGLNHVCEAILAAGTRQDADAAERHLRLAQGVKLPAKLEGLRHLATGLVRLQREQFKEALEALGQARRFNPDMPLLDFLEGVACNRLGDWARALKHLQAYRDLLGDEADVCREVGTALRGCGRSQEAAASSRKALDLDPKDADAFLGLLQALGPGDNRDDLAARFARLDNRHANFEVFAEDCREGEDFDSLERLALAMRAIDRDFAAVDYYLALVKVQARQAGQAVPLFRAALAKQKDAGKRDGYVTGFLQAMAAGGQAAEAYAAVPDSRGAFRVLAAELKKGSQYPELRRLLAAHGKKHPDDVLLPLYRGDALVQEGQYRLAEEAFAAGLAKRPDRGTLDPFRASRVLARYHTGKALAAYADIGPKQETFVQLAGLCLQDEDFPQLQALLEAHAKADPGNVDVPCFRYRMKIRQNQVAEAVALFKAALARPAPEDKRREMVSDFLGIMAEAGRPLEGYRAAPDAGQAFQVLAGELMEQARWQDLRRLVDAHRGRHPDDAWLALYTGELHLADKAWDQAARVLAGGWEKAPEELRQRLRWNYVTAMYRSGRALQAYAEAEARKEVFDQLAGLLATDKRWAELETLIAAHRPHAGDDPDLFYHQARAKVHLKRPAEAIPLIRKACEKQAVAFRRAHYVNTFVLDMDEVGRRLEGYRAAPDRAAAFQTLAGRLLYQEKGQGLDELLQEHGKTHGQDPLVWFYRGELHLLRGEVGQAERHFAGALAKAPPQNQQLFRHGLFRARVKAGKAAGAYREDGPGTQTFVDLANVCLADKNAGQLAELIAAHRTARPDDPDLPVWELEVKWLKRDYEGALGLLTEHRQGVFAQPRFRWKFEDYLVRCLVKLKRTGEAVREAEALVKKKQGNRVLLVYAHASRGDVKQAIAAMGDLLPRQQFLLEECYRDADLGPILRGEPFRAFRERFPEPKEKGGGAPAALPAAKVGPDREEL